MRPCNIARNGVTDVRAAKSAQRSPRRCSRFFSIETMPTAVSIVRLPNRISAAMSPFTIMCVTLHNRKPIRIGWRVTRTIPAMSSCP